MNVLCCCTGTRYEHTWVYRLRAMVEEHCSVPVRFRVITDHEIPGVETIHTTLPGWWAKLDFFRPGLFEGPCVSLDLDVTVVGDIADLQRTEFTAARETRRQNKMNSSVMAWEPTPRTNNIWTPDPPISDRKKNTECGKFWGDQSYIASKLPEYFLFGDEVLMYKKHIQDGVLPDEAKVVFFNTEPKPHRPEALVHRWNARTWAAFKLPEMDYATGDDPYGYH